MFNIKQGVDFLNSGHSIRVPIKKTGFGIRGFKIRRKHIREEED